MLISRIAVRALLVAAMAAVFSVAGTVSADDGEVIVVNHEGVITDATATGGLIIEGGLVDDGRMNYSYYIELEPIGAYDDEDGVMWAIFSLTGTYFSGNGGGSGSIDITGELHLNTETYEYVQPVGATSFGEGTGRTTPLSGATLDGSGQVGAGTVEGQKIFTLRDYDEDTQ
jgi:hypothetical protein